MKRIGIAGLLVAATLTMSAVLASSASAVNGPTWKTGAWAGACVKAAIWGWYEKQVECEIRGIPFPTLGGWDRVYGAGKTLKAGETRETEIFNQKFELAVSHKLLDSIASVECKTVKGTGTIEGGEPGKDTATITLTGCKVLNKETKEEAKGCTVKTKGAAEGTIEYKVKTELVYIGTKAQAEKQEEPVGDLYAPASGTEYMTLEFGGGKSCPAGSEGTTTVEGNAVATAAAGLELANEQTFPEKWTEKYFHYVGGKVAEVAVKRLKIFGINATEAGMLNTFIKGAKEGIEASPKS